MIFKEKIFTGKNGTHYTLRSPRPEDAEQMIGYLKRTAMETEYGISYHKIRGRSGQSDDLCI